MTLDNMHLVMQHAEDFYNESRYVAIADYDENVAVDTLANIVTSEYGLALIDTNSTAFIAASVHPHWFGNFKIATDYCIYVPKEYRGTTVGYRLLKTYVERATELGAKEIYFTDLANINRQGVNRLYEKLGFTAQGQNYIKTMGGH